MLNKEGDKVSYTRVTGDKRRLIRSWRQEGKGVREIVCENGLSRRLECDNLKPRSFISDTSFLITLRRLWLAKGRPNRYA